MTQYRKPYMLGFSIFVIIAILISVNSCSFKPPKSSSAQPLNSEISPSSLPLLSYITRSGALGIWKQGKISKIDSEGIILKHKWSPDGGKIACINIVNNKLFLKTFDFKNKLWKPLFEIKNGPESPLSWELEWSPQMNYILIDVGTSASGRTLQIIEASTGKPIRSIGYAYGYTWSPDEQHLLIGVPAKVEPPLPLENGLSSSIAILPFPDGKPKVILPGTTNAMYAPKRWLNSSTFEYSELISGTIYKATLAENIIEKVDVIEGDYDLKALILEAIDGSNIRSVVIDPNARYIAFSSMVGDVETIYVLDNQTKKVFRVGEGRDPLWRPR